MSFNRLRYDTDTYKHNLKQSIGTGDYRINTPQIDCLACFPMQSSFTEGMPTSVCEKEIVDVNSELLGITRKASNNPLDKYIPSNAPFCNTIPLTDCQYIKNEDTRLSNPPVTLRGTGWNRWEWLCKNPQDKALHNFDYNISNRIVAKDNHRPCIQRPVDQSPALPPGNATDDIHMWKGSANNYSECMKFSDAVPSTNWKCAKFFEEYGIKA